MTHRALLLLVLLATPPASRAEEPAGDVTGKVRRWGGDRDEIQAETELAAGYRSDRLDWSIAGPNGSPNVLSELTWKNLAVYQVRLTGRSLADDAVYVRTFLARGWIQDGSNRDSDYNGADRTAEFSRSDNGADGGDTLDFSFGLGRKFALGGSKAFTLAPLAGWSYHEQNLVIRDGDQTIPPRGPFAGLNSSYETQWSGPWLGLDWKARLAPSLAIFGCGEFHWASYHAEANWNLRGDFAHPKSFDQDADGTGFALSAGLEWALAERWSVTLGTEYQNWSTGEGDDRTFFANGTVARSRLNGVNWESWSAMLGLAWRF